MKLVHISDLHLGKRVNEFSMLEDQRHILGEILKTVDAEAPEGVLIAGDVYDKSVPGAEAVALLDDFLFELAKRGTEVFVISGNHDSAERIAFGGRLMERSGVHLAPVYGGRTAPVTLGDEYGDVNFYLLPFLRPANVRRFFPDREISSYTDALRAAVEAMEIDTRRRNVLVTHQFVTGAVRSESEDFSVGGADNVDASVFDGFDYVALGHLHAGQNVGRGTLRYCGTPLKYSFSEAGQEKSVTVVELGAKGDVAVRTAPLTPLRDLVELRGTYDGLCRRSFYEGTRYRESYLHITLTDEDDIPDAVGKLRIIYPFLMKLDYDNARTRAGFFGLEAGDTRRKSPMELLSEFYEEQNGRGMSGEQSEFVRALIEEIWGDER